VVRVTDVIACPSCGTKNRVPAAASGSPRCAKCKSPLPWLVEADDTTFEDVAGKSSVPVLVDLWAPWCGPCRMVAPAVEQIARDLAGRIKAVKVNVDESPQIARRYEAMSIPMLLVLDKGQLIDRQVGAVPAPVLRQFVDRALDHSVDA
jgi:thioredoxin 2